MADVVRRAEEVRHVGDGHADGLAFVVEHGVALALKGVEGRVVHDVLAGGILHAVDGASLAVDIGLRDEALAVLVRHEVPVPPGDDLVQCVAVALVVHPHLLYLLAVLVEVANLLRVLSVGPVGVEVGLHVEQLQAAMRGGGDGQRQVDGLRVGVGRAGVGRHLLVVDVHLALHVPVVGLGVVVRADDVGIVRGVAVVDNGLRRVDEVTRGLPFHGLVDVLIVAADDVGIIDLGSRRQAICCIEIAFVGTGLVAGLSVANLQSLVVLREQHVLLVGEIHWHAVLVLGIDETAAHLVALHVDEVQLHHARDVAVVLLLGGALLGGQLQEHAGGQGHLVGADALVAVALRVAALVAVGLVAVVGLAVGVVLLFLAVLVASRVAKLHVAGQVAHVVHQAVDAEVVAVGDIVTGNGMLLVERQLAHAVDGVLNVLAHVGHAVLGTLQHHARAVDAAEVGALYGVQQSAGVDGAEAEGGEGVAGRVAILLHQLQVVFL